jgi:uroporphyrinogen decarboxylase
MTPRDNFLQAMRRQNPAWTPFEFSLSTGYRPILERELGPGLDLATHFHFATRWLGPTTGTTRATPDWRALYYRDLELPPETVIDPEWGVARVYHAATDDERMFAPLREIETEADLDAYPWPDDVASPHRYAGVAEQVRRQQDQGFATVVGGLNFFEEPWARTGFEKMMLGMAGDEPWARKLFMKHAADQVGIAEQVARTGADVLYSSSDVATQLAPLLSPGMWRDWLFPMMRDAIAAAKRIKPDLLVFYHSCGNVEPLIPGFIEAGVDILNPLQPEAMDIFAIKQRFGERLSFWGGIGTQSLLPHGTPQQVRDTVRRTIDAMSANGGGYLCSPAHMIRPEVPWANVMAFSETVQELGHP